MRKTEIRKTEEKEQNHIHLINFSSERTFNSIFPQFRDLALNILINVLISVFCNFAGFPQFCRLLDSLIRLNFSKRTKRLQ